MEAHQPAEAWPGQDKQVSTSDDELALSGTVREQVIERDHHLCRFCGAWGEVLHVHHILYRSQGGSDTVGNLICLDWKHHDTVHRNGRLWRPVLETLVQTPGVTALQLRRWASATMGVTPEVFDADGGSPDVLRKLW